MEPINPERERERKSDIIGNRKFRILKKSQGLYPINEILYFFYFCAVSSFKILMYYSK